MIAIHNSQVASNPPTRAGRAAEDDSAGAATVMRWGRATPVARSSFATTKTHDLSRAPPAKHNGASSIPEGVPPLLARVADALVDFRDTRADRLGLADRLGARRRRHFRTKRDGEVLGVDRRRFDRIEVFHEEPG